MRHAAATALAAALLLAAACGTDAPSASTSRSEPASSGAGALAVGDRDVTQVLPATVRSVDGKTVTVTDTTRIVPLWGSLSEIVFELGLGDQVVARDTSATFDEVQDLPLVTRAHDVSAESVLSLRPTLVLADTDTGPPEAINQIRNVGVPVVVVDIPYDLDSVYERIRTIAGALGVGPAGEDLVARTKDAITEVQRAIPEGTGPRVAFLYLRGSAGTQLIAGPGSGADAMIEAAGGINAGTAMGLTQAFTPITSEALVKAAPDVLLLTTTGLASIGGVDGLVAIPGIAQTPAGKARKVITVEDGLLFGFGARTPDALQLLIDQLYGSAS